MKHKFYTEIAYCVGILCLALGTAMEARADFGVSMIVAPAYLLHLKLSETLPFFTFGFAEYCIQALLLVLLCIVTRKLNPKFLYSFATAIIYGLILDGMTFLLEFLPLGELLGRILYFSFGLILCSTGVAFLFHTYVAPEAYELFVKEFSATYHTDIGITKTVYDFSSLAVSVLLSFLFFGWFHFEGVKIGTIICAALNGISISLIGKFLDSSFEFVDGLPLRKFFE